MASKKKWKRRFQIANERADSAEQVSQEILEAATEKCQEARLTAEEIVTEVDWRLGIVSGQNVALQYDLERVSAENLALKKDMEGKSSDAALETNELGYPLASHVISQGELAEILKSAYPGDRFILAIIPHDSKDMHLVNGNFESCTVPLSVFVDGGNDVDYNGLEIRDDGRILALGDYEISSTLLIRKPDFHLTTAGAYKRVSAGV